MSKGSDAAAVPIDPAAEKAALGALAEFVNVPDTYSVAYFSVPHARTLKALLAEPRLPAEPTPEMLRVMRLECESESCTPAQAAWQAYRALYAHLTAPKTKTVEVWRVEWALGNYPMCHQHLSEADARASAKLIAEKHHRTCIHVTGPHKQEVPND